MRVVFAPEVEEDLYGLIKILVEKEYLLSLIHISEPTRP